MVTCLTLGYLLLLFGKDSAKLGGSNAAIITLLFYYFFVFKKNKCFLIHVYNSVFGKNLLVDNLELRWIRNDLLNVEPSLRNKSVQNLLVALVWI